MFSTGTRRKAAFLISSFLVIAAWIAIDAPSAFADDSVSIFDVRKSLPLDPAEAVYHDFYLNAGPESGLKKGMYVTIVRRLPVHDPVKNKAQATLSVEVARMKIIHVERNISVARLVIEADAEDRPLLEYQGPMIGDELDLTTVSMEAPKIKPKRRAALADSGESSMSSHAPAPGPQAAPQPAPQVQAPRVAPFIPLVPRESLETPKAEASEGDVPLPTTTSVEEKTFPVAPAPDMVRSSHDDGKRS